MPNQESRRFPKKSTPASSPCHPRFCPTFFFFPPNVTALFFSSEISPELTHGFQKASLVLSFHTTIPNTTRFHRRIRTSLKSNWWEYASTYAHKGRITNRTPPCLTLPNPGILAKQKITQFHTPSFPLRHMAAVAGPNSRSGWFAVPAPVRELFKLFPLTTLPADPLPERAPERTRPRPRLYVFARTEEDARSGRPSFNPQCLKWQVSFASGQRV